MPPDFIAYAQLDSSGAPTVPAHLAGDRMVQIMYGQNTFTVNDTPGEPTEPPGWDTVLFEYDPAFGFLRGVRVAEIIDADNSVYLIGAGSQPQRAVVVTRYGTLGASYATPVRYANDVLLPTLTAPAGSLVLWGVQTNQGATYTIPSGLTVLGDSRVPFSLGPTWINGISTAESYEAANKLLPGTSAAYSRSWAVVFYPS